MRKDLSVNVEHVTRVEGHGNIVFNTKEGKVEEIRWEVPEAPRFFEAMVKEHHWKEIPSIVSRICGICSIVHTLTAIKAIEKAFDVEPSEQTITLRKLALHAENIQSHMLHIGYLVAPDLFGVGSVFPLANSENKEALLKIIKLHRLANNLSDLLAGRTTHPTSLLVGGYVIPNYFKLTNMVKDLEEGLALTRDVAGVVKDRANALPDFKRETEYFALSAEEEYALYDGIIKSSDTGKSEDYKEVLNEYVVPWSTAKHAKHARDSYMVGALARFNINSYHLSKEGKDIADMFGLRAPCYNPFMNTIAQLAEVAHCLEDSIDKINGLKGLKEEKPVEVKPRKSQAFGACEAPRGLLVHDYSFNDGGFCTKANLIIPTNQNHGNIQKDMEFFAPTLLGKSEKEIELALEMLVRAYDPCISCSTHYVKVSFK